MSDTQQQIALALLERTGAYLQFFLTVDIHQGDPLSETQKNAIKFLEEIIKFLKEVKRI